MPKTTTMYDGVNTDASKIPADAKVVAGYLNGEYAWSRADWARFPHATHVQIQVYIPGEAVTNAGDVLDVEQMYAGSPEAQAATVQWVRDRERSGITPTVYTSASARPELEAALEKAGLAGRVDWWEADYVYHPYQAPGAAATQWTDGANWDTSGVGSRWLATIVADHRHEAGGGGTSRRSPSKRVVMEAGEMQALVATLDGGLADVGAAARTVDGLARELDLPDVDPTIADEVRGVAGLVASIGDTVRKLTTTLPAQAHLVDRTRRDLLGVDRGAGTGTGLKVARTTGGATLVPVGGGHRLTAPAAAAWKRLEAAARKDGIHLPVTGGYRPYGTAITAGVVRGALGVARRADPHGRHAGATDHHDPTSSHDDEPSPGSHNVVATAGHLYGREGVDIGTTVGQELHHGTQIGGSGPAAFDHVRHELRKGDLLFYRNGDRGPTHVAVYLGHGRVLDRGGPNEAATVRPLTSKVLGCHFLEARRYATSGHATPAEAARSDGTGVQVGVQPGSPAARWLRQHAAHYGFHGDGGAGDYRYTPPAPTHQPAPAHQPAPPHQPAPHRSPSTGAPGAQGPAGPVTTPWV